MNIKDGRHLFLKECAECHNYDASGAGPASLGLGMKPPSLTKLSAANNGAFPRDYVMSKIYGLKQNGHTSEVMPDFGEGDLGPLIQVEKDGISTPIPADLLALANYLESIQH
ncbi:cytochrome c [Amylibacter sp. SFDW26]|nr:cytochrome c [Amylibacter sp. SFDW26]